MCLRLKAWGINYINSNYEADVIRNPQKGERHPPQRQYGWGLSWGGVKSRFVSLIDIPSQVGKAIIISTAALVETVAFLALALLQLPNLVLIPLHLFAGRLRNPNFLDRDIPTVSGVVKLINRYLSKATDSGIVSFLNFGTYAFDAMGDVVGIIAPDVGVHVRRNGGFFGIKPYSNADWDFSYGHHPNWI